MPKISDEFEKLVSDAEAQAFTGWDFSYISGRCVEERPPWDYHGIVLRFLKTSGSLLDLGTGGGELLGSLQPLPKVTVATEGYAPNTAVALSNLRPFGADIVQNFCDDNGRGPQRGALPFRNSAFELVIDRNESYMAEEVFRVLKPGGRFVTQQVGEGNDMELRRVFGTLHGGQGWTLDRATDDVSKAGLVVEEQGRCSTKSRFLDVGALVYFMRAMPWEFPGFSAHKFDRELREVDAEIRSRGRFDVTTTRFYLVARKPEQ
jgi:SAM-dependent methyltransferase